MNAQTGVFILSMMMVLSHSDGATAKGKDRGM
jgi:hypothetical protein